VRVDWAGSFGGYNDRGILLADGSRVTRVEDLLHVVPSDSMTAKAVRSRSRLLDEADMMFFSGAAGATGALIGMTASVVEHHGDNMLALWAVIGGFAALAISSGVRARMAASTQRARAFEAYETSLRQRLELDEGETTCPRR
jgi:hypothetical protein